MNTRLAALALVTASMTAIPVRAADVPIAAPPAPPAPSLARLVRLKISAGDLATGEAAAEEYRRTKGVDPDYLDAVGWLARGSAMLGRPEKAAAHVAELRREIPRETPELVVPLGAAIEVESKLRFAREGRGAAVRFLGDELLKAKDLALRSRIEKNVNLLTLEGRAAPEIGAGDRVGPEVPRLASLKGKPVLLFLWAHGCGDCKAQAPILNRVLARYRARGLTLIAPTRFYGEHDDGKAATPAEEKADVAKSWAAFEGLDGVPVPIDTETMVRYGASATPTLVLIDRQGMVRLYTPTRMSESELSRRIEEVLSEPAS